MGLIIGAFVVFGIALTLGFSMSRGRLSFPFPSARRFVIEMDDENIQRLVRQAGLSDRRELLNEAISLYAGVVRRVNEGSALLIDDGTNEPYELVTEGLSRLREPFMRGNNPNKPPNKPPRYLKLI